ncbi:MAG: BTAD domain-containing putative transcriptional regulator, partial [Acidimicrobiia bacterium]|nr:BTAD domain-containing putative transcriptional regulator [Acidimicrobiia bacterium]
VELEQLTGEHPYRERLWQQLMLALYRSGRQVDALRTFQSLRQTLGEDLGIDPAPESNELERAILLHDPDLLWEPPPPPSNLPASLTSFVGRAVEIAEVTKLIDTARLVTLTGPGGIGKTRLALEAAKRVRDRFADGLWWIDLAPLRPGDEVVAEVARVLGVAAQPGKTLTESVAQSLVRRTALLVLDNCEHVADGAAAFVSDALRVADGIRVLATSRVPLRVSGESLWIVPALSMPDSHSDTAPGLPYSDAIELFVERGAGIAPWFRLDATNSAEVVAICTRLDAIPLAIEMAAAHLRVMTPSEIAGALYNRFEVLVRREHDRVLRHETLQTALDWSYELLLPELQTAFDNLAVFPGSFSLDAATHIAFVHAEDLLPRGIITALVESSMVTTLEHRGDTRFRLLETLREYGLANLRASGRLEGARDAHANYFVRHFAPAAADVGEPPFVEWISRLASSYGDVELAMEWLFERDRAIEALTLAPALLHYWVRTGNAPEARRWGKRMVESGSDSSPELRSAAHAAISFAGTIMADDPAQAVAHADRAIALGRDSNHRRALVMALFVRANAALLVGDFEALYTAATEGIEESERTGFNWGRGGCLSTLAFWHFYGGGSLDNARALGTEAVSIFRAVGDLGGQVVLNPVPAIALRQGDMAAAERYALDTAAVASGTGWEATALVNLAEVYLAQGELENAEQTLERAAVRALDTGLENWLRMALRDMAQVALRRGNALKAARLMGASRRNMPVWGLDPSVYEPLESKTTEILGAASCQEAADEGFALDTEGLLKLAL